MRIASLTVTLIFCGIVLVGSWIAGGAAWNRFSGSPARRLHYVWTRGFEFSTKVKDPLVTLNGGWNRILRRRERRVESSSVRARMGLSGRRGTRFCGRRRGISSSGSSHRPVLRGVVSYGFGVDVVGDPDG